MAPRMMRARRLSRMDNNNRLPIGEIFRQGSSSNSRVEITSNEETEDGNFSDQADMNARRTRRRIATSGNLEVTVEASDSNLKGKMSVESENNSVEPKNKASEPPKEHVFICSICMEPLAEEMSTMCGHIFCKKCITTAITSNSACPTCRKYVSKKQLIRVFLSSPT